MNVLCVVDPVIVKEMIMNKPNALLCADNHIRFDIPICRTDDYLEAQRRKLSYIAMLARKYNIPIFNAGDLFDKGNTSRFWEVQAINIFRGIQLYIIPGNHDLIGHSFENFHNSSIGVINAAFEKMNDVLVSHPDFKYSGALEWKNKKIAIIHEYVQVPKNRNDKIQGYSTKEIFNKLADYDLILIGDNHITFTVKNKETGQLLVNPGSMMRMTADQINHKPCVFLWCAETNTVEQVFLPIEEDVIDVSHIDIQKAKEDRTNAFIERMNHEYELSLSFQGNMQEHLKVNKVRPAVENIIWSCVEGRIK
jgi:DNA repair exonuclease SbcCD nuclease subunit